MRATSACGAAGIGQPRPASRGLRNCRPGAAGAPLRARAYGQAPRRGRHTNLFISRSENVESNAFKYVKACEDIVGQYHRGKASISVEESTPLESVFV